MAEDGRPVVLETGSLYTRADFAGNEFPSVTVQTKYDSQPDDSSAACEAGPEAGAGLDWDKLVSFWDALFSEKLGTRAENQPVLFVDWAESTKPSRELLTQVAFEGLGVPAMYLAAPAVLALYAVNRTTGLSIDLGHTGVRVAPVYEGFQFSYATTVLPLGGQDMEAQLRALVIETHIGDAGTSQALDALDWRLMKEAVAEIRPKKTAMTEPTDFPTKTYPVVGGREVSITSEQYFGCSEILFAAEKLRSRKIKASLIERIHLSLMQCEPDIRRELAGNILLYGGGAQVPGLSERLRTELVDILPSSMHPNVSLAKEPSTVCWRGGSILASLTMFQQLWVTKQEYNENGPLCVLRKDTMR
jgi:actin